MLQRFKHVILSKNYDVNDVKAGREIVLAYINFVVSLITFTLALCNDKVAAREETILCIAICAIKVRPHVVQFGKE